MDQNQYSRIRQHQYSSHNDVSSLCLVQRMACIVPWHLTLSPGVQIGLYAGPAFQNYDSGIIDCTYDESDYWVVRGVLTPAMCYL